MAKKRIITTDVVSEEEKRSEIGLRPQFLSDYIGQGKIKESLKIYIEAAKSRGESLDHALFYGPPGLGKTTLAGIIANEMGVSLRTTAGPALEKPGDIASILYKLNEGDVLFIDEIHRIPRNVEEFLYSAMEDFTMDVLIGEGTTAVNKRFNLPKFTLIGATTRAGMLSAPLRDRFGIVERLEYYNADELAEIVRRSGDVLRTVVDDKSALQIALCSRGTPRIANRFLKRVRDYAAVVNDGVLTEDVTEKALALLNIDRYGLDDNDRKMLLSMIENFGGGPVGLASVAVSIGEDAGTLEEVYEPFLVQNGFLARTPRGRIVLPKAYEHLGIEVLER